MKSKGVSDSIAKWYRFHRVTPIKNYLERLLDLFDMCDMTDKLSYLFKHETTNYGDICYGFN